MIMQCKWTFRKYFILYTTKKVPHLTVTITKNVTNASMKRAFLFKYALPWSVKKEALDCHGFQWNYKLWLRFTMQAGLPAPSWCIKLNMFLKISGGIAWLLSPDWGSVTKACQHHLETRAANVWDLVQSDKYNIVTYTGQLTLWRPAAFRNFRKKNA